MLTRRHVLAGTAGLLAAPMLARAQTAWPSRPITIVVPFPAGGTTDLLARSFGQHMSETLGQPVIVENKGGAGGSVGAEFVARATADGHTLLFHNLTFSATTVALQLAGKSKHDIAKDFRPVALAANVPMVVLATQSIAAKDLGAFVTLARGATEPFFYGSTGNGSTMHLVMEVLKRDAGIKLDHVAFRGAAPLVQELIAGRIAIGGDQLSTSLEHVRAGTLKPMATLAAERIALLPDVPTVSELGFKNMELRGWNGFFAPAATPDDVVAKLNAAITKAATDATLKPKLAALGAETVGGPAATLDAVVTEQVNKVRPLLDDLKITL